MPVRPPATLNRATLTTNRSSPTQVRTRAPGTIPAWARANANTGAPRFEWPASLEHASGRLLDAGFRLSKESNSQTSLFTKGKERVALSKLQLAGTNGYVVEHGNHRQVQLGDLTFSAKQWDVVSGAYKAQLETYNSILRRPLLLARSPLPRSGSEFQGAHDGIKHFIHLGEPLDQLTERRMHQQQVVEARERVKDAIDAARTKGTMPKHVAIVVEGLDGASKTGNGLSLARVLETEGYAVKSRSFKSPTAEERAQGPMQRYRDFIDLSAAQSPTVWFLDRGFPGDYVHNPKASLEGLARETRQLEQGLAANDVMLVKLLFSPGQEAPLATFGKRLARSKVAADLLERRTDLTKEERASLRSAVAMKPGLNDFRSVIRSQELQQRYEDFAHADGGWSIIDTSDRHSGRLSAVDAFIRRLDTYKPPTRRAIRER